MFVKKHFSIFLLLLVFLLPACGKDNTDIFNIVSPTEVLPSDGTSDPSSETQGGQPAATGNPYVAEEMPDEEREVGRKRGEMLPIELMDPAEYADFENESDYSPGNSNQRASFRDYVLDGNILYLKSPYAGDPLIYCLDLETEDCYSLCSKPECFHNSLTCNAWATSSAYDDTLEEYSGSAWVNLDQERLILYDATNLFYRRLDGSGGGDIGSLRPNLFDFGNGGMGSRSIMTHHGYVYTGQDYYTDKGSVIRFIRMSVAGGELEVIWEHARPKISQAALNMRFGSYYGVGDKIYFFVIDERLANGGTSTRLYCYDTVKDEVFLCREFAGEIYREYPRDGKWYYVHENSFYSWNPATGEEICLYANTEAKYQDTYGVTYYNGGFCLWEGEEWDTPNPEGWNSSHVLWVHFYDWDGNYIAKIAPPTTPTPVKFYVKGFMGDYLIYNPDCKVENGHQDYIAVLDTSRLGDPSLEWMVFELADYLPQ